MPGRTVPLVEGEYYHIFNRGSDKKAIFHQPRDYKRFQQTFYYYQFMGPKPRFSLFNKKSLNQPDLLTTSKMVSIICYCLMPNHFHFLVRQLAPNGISIFLSNLSNSFTKYSNIKYGFIGPRLQGAFKAVRVESDEQLLHLSRYIHLNPFVAGLVKDLADYQWSSYKEYANQKPGFCATEEILGFFSSKDKYLQFIEDQKEYGATLEILKHQLVDE